MVVFLNTENTELRSFTEENSFLERDCIKQYVTIIV